jgi:alkaline phosphatase
MRFAIVNDFHHGPVGSSPGPAIPKPGGARRKLTEQAEGLVKRILTSLESEKDLGFLVNLGDLIEDVREKDSDKDRFGEVLSWFQDFPLSVYHLIGNHDVRTLSDQEVSELLGYEKTYYSWDFGNYHFVALSFEMTGNHQQDITDILAALPQEQLTWLEQDLAQTNKPAVIFEHYGLAEDNMEGNFWFGDGMHRYATLSNRAEVRRVLKESGKVRAVFTAHQHWNRFHVVNNIPYFTTNSLVENFRNEGVPAATWTVVELSDDRILVDIRGNDPEVYQFIPEHFD